MAKTKIHVGLEIGSTKTCMVVGEVKPDGSVKIVVSNQQPGPQYKNWLYTCDHQQGGMLGRLVKASVHPPAFPARVFKIASLHESSE